MIRWERLRAAPSTFISKGMGLQACADWHITGNDDGVDRLPDEDGATSHPEHVLVGRESRFSAERGIRAGRQFVRCPRFRDRGSGTAMGAALIAVVAILLLVIAAGANVLLSISRAHTAADQGALAAASALRNGDSFVCLRSRSQVRSNNAVQESCTVVQEDVTVTVSVATDVPFLPRVRVQSRAGPVDCS